MRQVSIQDLKGHLSEHIDRAAEGERILVTRHNRGVAILSPATQPGVRVGARVGGGGPTRLLRRATRGSYLAILAADRDDR